MLSSLLLTTITKLLVMVKSAKSTLINYYNKITGSGQKVLNLLTTTITKLLVVVKSDTSILINNHKKITSNGQKC